MFTGEYCANEGLQSPNGTCAPGYYCPVGQTSATPANYSCEPGYYCAGALSAPQECASGTYQVGGQMLESVSNMYRG